MKKVSLIFAGLILLATFYNFVAAKESNQNMQEVKGDYIIIRYSPYGSGGKNSVVVNYGGLKLEKLEIPKETLKEAGTTNFVIDLLNQFNEKGFTLISTTSYSLEGNSEITCFLKQSK